MTPTTNHHTRSTGAFFNAGGVLKRRWRLLTTLPFLSAAIALGIGFLIKPTFTSSAQIMTPQSQSTAAGLLGSLGGLAGVAGGAIPGLKNPADQWIGLLKSRTIADALVSRFSLRDRYNVEFQFQAREALASKSTITAGKDSLIDIAVTDVDPRVAADIANGYINELQRLTKSLAVSEASQRRLFFQRQLEDAKDNLLQAELSLQQSGINEQIINTSPEAAVEGIARLKVQIATTEVKVSVMRGTMTGNNPELQNLERELLSLRAQLAAADAPRTAGAPPKASSSSYVTKLRNFKYYEALFEMMARQYEIARADEAKDGAVIQIVDSAQVPEWKSGPKRALITVLAFLAGLAGAVTLAFFQEQIRPQRRKA